MRPAADQPDDVHQHSGWLIPLVFFCLVGALSGLFLLYYLRPGPRDNVPSGDARIVSLSVQGLKLSVPANYIKTAAARTGGAQKLLSLVALLPDMTGYSESEGRLFATNAPDSPVLNILLHGEPNGMPPEARLARIYMPYVADNPGGGPFGLTHYAFQPNSAYSRNELFTGKTRGRLVLLICERPMPDLPSPNCIVTDRPLRPGLSMSYRFKRAYLSRWPQIEDGVDALLARFEAQPR